MVDAIFEGLLSFILPAFSNMHKILFMANGNIGAPGVDRAKHPVQFIRAASIS